MRTSPWTSVGIVADIEPSGAWPTVASFVATSMLSARLANAAVATYACRSPQSLDLAPAAWRPLDELAIAVPPLVVACGPNALRAIDRLEGTWSVIDAPELGRPSGLAAMLPHLLDPVALDVRRRMLVHLGVIPSGNYVLDDDALAAVTARFPLRPADLHLLAAGATEIACSDWLPHDLTGDAPTRAATDTIHAWATDLRDAMPEEVTDRLDVLEREVGRLRAIIDGERDQHAAEVERLSEALTEALARAESPADRAR
jgi:hypothetical protein